MKLTHDNVMGELLAVTKTLDRTSNEFYWPDIAGDVFRFVQSFDSCQEEFPKENVTNVPLGNIKAPFHRVAIDLVGPFS